MKKLLILFAMLVTTSCATAQFPFHTNKLVMTTTTVSDFNDFSWVWSDYDSEIIDVSFKVPVSTNGVLFRMSYPKNGTNYLEASGFIVQNTTNIYGAIPKTNALANRTYYAEFLLADTNNDYYVTLAKGKVTTKWSLFNNTQTVNNATIIIRPAYPTNLVISSSVTNGLGATMLLGNTASKVLDMNEYGITNAASIGWSGSANFWDFEGWSVGTTTEVSDLNAELHGGYPASTFITWFNALGAGVTNAQGLGSNATASVVIVGLNASNAQQVASNAAASAVLVGSAASNAQVVASNAATSASLLLVGDAATNAQETISNLVGTVWTSSSNATAVIFTRPDAFGETNTPSIYDNYDSTNAIHNMVITPNGGSSMPDGGSISIRAGRTVSFRPSEIKIINGGAVSINALDGNGVLITATNGSDVSSLSVDPTDGVEIDTHPAAIIGDWNKGGDFKVFGGIYITATDPEIPSTSSVVNVISITTTGGLQVGSASFHADTSGNIWQDSTNYAGFGIVTGVSFRATGSAGFIGNGQSVTGVNALTVSGHAGANLATVTNLATIAILASNAAPQSAMNVVGVGVTNAQGNASNAIASIVVVGLQATNAQVIASNAMPKAGGVFSSAVTGTQFMASNFVGSFTGDAGGATNINADYLGSTLASAFLLTSDFQSSWTNTIRWVNPPVSNTQHGSEGQMARRRDGTNVWVYFYWNHGQATNTPGWVEWQVLGRASWTN